MKRPIRKKIVREKLEKRLLKNERRMQSIAEESYKIRTALEGMPVVEPPKEETAETVKDSTNEGAANVPTTDLQG